MKQTVPIFLIAIMFTLSCHIAPTNIETPTNFEYYKSKYRLAYSHYKRPKDSLKLKALDFIIKNLPFQYHYGSVTLSRYDSVLLANSNRNEYYLKSTLDSLIMIYGNNIKLVNDSKVITSHYLINNIDAAFKSWEYNWDGTKLCFNDFCEYILPYKLENEKPEYWRQSLINEFKEVYDSLGKKPNTIFEATGIVNERLNSFKVSFDYDHPIDLGYNKSKLLSIGSCYMGTKIVAFPLRAIGIPVVIDYAYWGNRSMVHYWNAIIYKNKPYPFDAIDSKIGDYKIRFTGENKILRKLPKVFRKTFSAQKNSLQILNNNSEEIPINLSNIRVKDVTCDYIPVSDIELRLSSSFNGKRFSYLCVFDNKNWIPVWWGKIVNNRVEFKNMGRDIVYLPCLIKNSKLSFIGNPIILDEKGKTIELNANLNLKSVIPIDRKYPEDISNEIEVGDMYELLYWKDGWQSLGIQKATKKILYFRNAPDNALFWIRDLSKGKQERIFTYKNKKIRWY